MPEIDPEGPGGGGEPGPDGPQPDPVFPGGGGDEGPSGGGGFDPGHGGVDPEHGGGGFDPVEPPNDNPDRPNAPPDGPGGDGHPGGGGGDEPPNDDGGDDSDPVIFHDGGDDDDGNGDEKDEINSHVKANGDSVVIEIQSDVSSSGRPSGGVIVEATPAVAEAAKTSLISRLFHSTGFRYFSRLASVAATANGVIMMTIHTAGGAFDPDDMAFTTVGTLLAIHEYIQWIKEPEENENGGGGGGGAHPPPPGGGGNVLARNLKSNLAHGTHPSARKTFATIDSAEDNATAAPAGAIDYWAITVAAGRPLNEASVARWIVAASDRRDAGIKLSDVTPQMARDVWNGIIAWYATSEAEFWTNYRPDVPAGEDNNSDTVLAQIVTLETYKDMAARDGTLSPTFKWHKMADALGLRDGLVDLYTNSGAAAVYDYMAKYEYQGAPLSRKVACNVVLAALGQVYLNNS